MQKRVLFVCLGNICRSPSAEAVMKQQVEEAGLSDRILVDSAGTGSWHVGEPADARMRAAGRRRGYDLTSISRQVKAPEDFDLFDYIVVMDNDNLSDMRRLDRHRQYQEKLTTMCSFCTVSDAKEVPDPYYGGPEGFNHVIDILEDACSGLLAKIKDDLAAAVDTDDES